MINFGDSKIAILKMKWPYFYRFSSHPNRQNQSSIHTTNWYCMRACLLIPLSLIIIGVGSTYLCIQASEDLANYRSIATRRCSLYARLSKLKEADSVGASRSINQSRVAIVEGGGVTQLLGCHQIWLTSAGWIDSLIRSSSNITIYKLLTCKLSVLLLYKYRWDSGDLRRLQVCLMTVNCLLIDNDLLCLIVWKRFTREIAFLQVTSIILFHFK